MAIKNKIKSALIYPIAVLIVAFIVLAVIMIFVIPAFKDVFTSFGADLPAPTLVVIAMSEFFVKYWWAIFGFLGGGTYFFFGLSFGEIDVSAHPRRAGHCPRRLRIVGRRGEIFHSF